MGSTDSRNLTRRGFLAAGGLLVSSLALRPTSDGGCYLLSPTTAYAAGGGDIEGTFTVRVGSASTAQFKVVDTQEASLGSNIPGVSGATITILPLNVDFDVQPITVEADEHGLAIFDLADYTEKNDEGPKYVCNVSIKINCDGHQEVFLPKVRLIGAHAYGLPLPSLDQDGSQPFYLRTLSFNNTDVQYTKSSFMYALTNAKNHTIKAELWNRDGADCTMEFYKWSSTSESFTSFTANAAELILLGTRNITSSNRTESAESGTGAFYSAELSGPFLKMNHNFCFEDGDRLVVRVLTSRYDYYVVARASFKLAPFDVEQTGDRNFLPGLVSAGSQSISFPSGFPVMGGLQVPIWTPNLPFVYAINPFGYLMAGISYAASGLAKGNPFKGDNWTDEAYETAKQQADSDMEVMEGIFNAIMDQRDELYDNGGKKTKFGNVKLFPKFTVVFTVQGYAALSKDFLTDGSPWKGSVNGNMTLSGAYVFVVSVIAGVVPLYLCISPSVTASFGVRLGAMTYWPDGDEDFSAKLLKFFTGLSLDYGGTGMALTITADLTISAGVGVVGVVNVGGRGSAGISVYIGFSEGSSKDHDDEVEYPHVVVSAYVGFYAAVQAFLWKATFKIWDKQWPRIYDSWQEASLSALGDGEQLEEAALGAMPDEYKLPNSPLSSLSGSGDGMRISMDDFLEASVPTTQDQLQVLAETMANNSGSLSDLDDGASASTLVAGSVAHDDGTFSLVYATSDLLEQAMESVAAGGSPEVGSASLSSLSDDDDYEDDSEPILDYDYEAIAGHLVNDGANVSSLSGVDEDGGVNVDAATIIENALSDGRPKFARVTGSYGGTGIDPATGTVMFRIASVKYGDYACSRLVMQTKTPSGWGKPRGVDFKVPSGKTDEDGEPIYLDRSSVFDYDFDLCEFEVQGNTYAALLILSGERDPSDEDVSLGEAATRPIMSFVIVGGEYKKNADGDSSWQPRARSARSWRTFQEKDGGYGDNTYFAYSPKLTVGVTFDPPYTGAPYEWDYTVLFSGAYLYKKADDVKGAIADGTAPKVRVFSTYVNASETMGRMRTGRQLLGMELNDTGDIIEICGGTAVAHVDEDSNDRTRESFSYFGFRTSEGLGVFSVRSSYVLQDDKLSGGVSICNQPDSILQKLYPWRGHGTEMIAVKNAGTADEPHSELRSATVPTEALGSVTIGDLLGPEQGMPAEFLQTSGGDVLVYVENDQGGMTPIEDENGNAVLDEDGTIKMEPAPSSYRIMGMRLVCSGGVSLFTKPFVIARTSHPADAVAAVTSSSSSTDIMICHISNLSESRCEYYEVKVPHVASATPVALCPVDDFAMAGQPCTFDVTLRNDGNVLVNGAEITLLDADEDNKVLAENVSVEISAETVKGSSDLRAADDSSEGTTESTYVTGYESFANHPLGMDGGRTIVAPGNRATVRVSADIPDDWSGSRNITVRVSKIRYIDPLTGESSISESLKTSDGEYAAGLSGLSDEEGGVSAFGEQTIDGLTTLHIAEATGDLGRFGDAIDGLVVMEDAGGAGGGSGSTSGGGNGADGDALPDTGDTSVLAGAASLVTGVTGALGAAMMAYSKRRQDVEREEHDE